jgi:ABC-type nitrate/sulfonate/bicarbonate transport system permease component
MRQELRRWLPALLVLGALVGLWELLVRNLDVAPYILPAPSEVWGAFVRTRSVLPDAVWATVRVAVVGLALGAAVGVAVAVPVAAIPVVRRVVQPLLVGSQSIPSIVLAPLFIVWFGFGTLPRVLVVALVGFFPVAVATVSGLTTADRDMVELVRAMGAGRATLLRRVLIPGALPSFFAGLRIAAAYAMFGAVVAEWIGADEGLGIYLSRSQRSYRTDQMFVAIALIALVSMALFALVGALSRLAMPWTAATHHRPEEVDRT